MKNMGCVSDGSTINLPKGSVYTEKDGVRDRRVNNQSSRGPSLLKNIVRERRVNN